MRINKSTSHAVRILIDCAKSGDQLIKVAEIAERLDITQQNAFKIVHLLSRSGFLNSVRGRRGGVRLARPATEIRIGDVVRAIEFTELNGKEAGTGASLSEIVDDALEAFISVLDQHTLAQMAKSGQNVPGASSGGKSPTARPAARGAPATPRQPRRGPQQSAAIR
jgi:Rrf2 family transcriptional regulator, nitric oxide-sensitive transcriptional repressor